MGDLDDAPVEYRKWQRKARRMWTPYLRLQVRRARPEPGNAKPMEWVRFHALQHELEDRCREAEREALAS